MTGPRTLVRTPLVRRQTGHDLDLIGYDTEHITLGSEVLYRNPYPGRRWMDEEIAMATLLERTADWVRGEGPEPYPLAEGSQDQQIALAIEESADSDTTITTSREAWSLNPGRVRRSSGSSCADGSRPASRDQPLSCAAGAAARTSQFDVGRGCVALTAGK